MKKSIAFYVLLLCLTLLGCNTNGKSSLIPLVSPVATNPQFPKTTETFTPQVPTSTVSPMLATQSEKMKEYSQILETRGVYCRDGYNLESWNEILFMSNETWTVFTCSPKNVNSSSTVDYSSRYTQVVNTDLSQSWTISHNNFTWSNRPDSLLSTYKWSQDGKYLYLIPHISGIDGFSTSAYFQDASSLYRLDLANGNFETLLNDVISFSLSPNDQLLICSQSDEPAVIHVLDLSSGVNQQINLDKEASVIGAFVWDADSTKVVFASGYSNNNGDYFDNLSATSIFLLTMKDLRLQTLLHRDSRLLVPTLEFPRVGHWIDTNTISLTSLEEGNEFLNDMSLNIQTGKIMNFVTPTTESRVTPTR